MLPAACCLQHSISAQALDVLSKSTDAKGRPLQVRLSGRHLQAPVGVALLHAAAAAALPCDVLRSDKGAGGTACR